MLVISASVFSGLIPMHVHLSRTRWNRLDNRHGGDVVEGWSRLCSSDNTWSMAYVTRQHISYIHNTEKREDGVYLTEVHKVLSNVENILSGEIDKIQLGIPSDLQEEYCTRPLTRLRFDVSGQRFDSLVWV